MAKKKDRIRKAPTSGEQIVSTRTVTKIDAKETKSGILSLIRPVLRPFRWLIPRYFVNSLREVKQVTWPSRRETWRLTLAVFVFAIVFGALIAGVDKVLDLLFKKVILKQ